MRCSKCGRENRPAIPRLSGTSLGDSERRRARGALPRARAHVSRRVEGGPAHGTGAGTARVQARGMTHGHGAHARDGNVPRFASGRPTGRPRSSYTRRPSPPGAHVAFLGTSILMLVATARSTLVPSPPLSVVSVSTTRRDHDDRGRVRVGARRALRRAQPCRPPCGSWSRRCPLGSDTPSAPTRRRAPRRSVACGADP
jgi:hypothetical protein